MAIRHLHGCQYGSSPANHLHRESLIHYEDGWEEVLPMRTETSVILSSEAGGEMGNSEII